MRSFNDTNKRNVARIIHYIINPENNISENIVNRIIKEMLWSASADYNKLDDSKYRTPIWSENACEFYETWLGNGKIGLRHEHMYPKKLLKREILANRGNITEDEIFNLLYEYAHAAVVTQQDHDMLRRAGFYNNLPEMYVNNHDYNDLDILFSRYTETGINLRFVDWTNNNPFTDQYYLNNGAINYDFIANLNFN